MKRVCVFCGSSSGRRESYGTGAKALGRQLARRGCELVYGGARVGLMGAVAGAALEAGGKVTGVIPEAIAALGIAHPDIDELRVVATMHERKALMAELADGFVTLPGGIGTLEEFFEMLTWGQLGYHQKPCGLLNVEGYFDGLLGFLDHTVAELFVKAPHRDMLVVEAEPETLLNRMADYRAPRVSKLNRAG